MFKEAGRREEADQQFQNELKNYQAQKKIPCKSSQKTYQNVETVSRVGKTINSNYPQFRHEDPISVNKRINEQREANKKLLPVNHGIVPGQDVTYDQAAIIRQVVEERAEKYDKAKRMDAVTTKIDCSYSFQPQLAEIAKSDHMALKRYEDQKLLQEIAHDFKVLNNYAGEHPGEMDSPTTQGQRFKKLNEKKGKDSGAAEQDGEDSEEHETMTGAKFAKKKGGAHYFKSTTRAERTNYSPQKEYMNDMTRYRPRYDQVLTKPIYEINLDKTGQRSEIVRKSNYNSVESKVPRKTLSKMAHMVLGLKPDIQVAPANQSDMQSEGE